MASRGHGPAGGRGNRERDDRGKRPMVDPDPIREPVEETFEEGELAPIIMGQPTSPSTRGQGGLEVEGTVIGTTRASALWWFQILYASRWRRRNHRIRTKGRKPVSRVPGSRV
ncbi:hypothetical protein R1sor_024603 [Riccia sorocarpa]|uniref:Uncharacterized protein n=1 Tax=Riccia sorocarpa TaxID=122646 RepID=A0ABD3GQZ4_9MARC